MIKYRISGSEYEGTRQLGSDEEQQREVVDDNSVSSHVSDENDEVHSSGVTPEGDKSQSPNNTNYSSSPEIKPTELKRKKETHNQ